jgi:acetyl esterase/lipase
VGEWLRGLGISAYVLKYRLPHTKGADYRHPVPLSDLQQAIRLIRRSAESRGIMRDRIGVLGFSAGGHLAATALTLFARPVHESEISCRPDFGMLIYPVVSFVDPCAHGSSRDGLAGRDADPKRLRLLSPECHVTSATPPIFLVHARNDNCVPYRNSVLLHEACLANGVEAELHLYARGGHGFGMGEAHQDASAWPRRAEGWLRRIGMMPARE